jgi:hypothetical protein
MPILPAVQDGNETEAQTVQTGGGSEDFRIGVGVHPGDDHGGCHSMQATSTNRV